MRCFWEIAATDLIHLKFGLLSDQGGDPCPAGSHRDDLQVNTHLRAPEIFGLCRLDLEAFSRSLTSPNWLARSSLQPIPTISDIVCMSLPLSDYSSVSHALSFFAAGGLCVGLGVPGGGVCLAPQSFMPSRFFCYSATACTWHLRYVHMMTVGIRFLLQNQHNGFQEKISEGSDLRLWELDCN